MDTNNYQHSYQVRSIQIPTSSTPIKPTYLLLRGLNTETNSVISIED